MNGRVLVVEDHTLVAIGLQLALSARGWDVSTTDGPTADAIVNEAEAFQPQVVLLDIGLGDEVGSGIDLIKPLRATGRRRRDAHRRDPAAPSWPPAWRPAPPGGSARARSSTRSWPASTTSSTVSR